MKPTNDLHFKEIYDLLEEAFPPSEIRTSEGQLALLSNPLYQLHTVKEADGKLLGILAGWKLSGFRFIEHLAVAARARGKGTGKSMVEDYIHMAGTPVILEVEPPDQPLAARRIEFYKRLGFHLNTFPYYQPPLRKGQPLLPLQVMSYPFALTEEQFGSYKEELYREVYGVTPKSISSGGQG